MSFRDINNIKITAEAEIARAIGARNILLNEIKSQPNWENKVGLMVNKYLSIAVTENDLLNAITNESTDANYIHMVTHLLRCGWMVATRGGHVSIGPAGACVMRYDAREAIIMCISSSKVMTGAE